MFYLVPGEQASALKKAAENFNIPILVTNQVRIELLNQICLSASHPQSCSSFNLL